MSRPMRDRAREIVGELPEVARALELATVIRHHRGRAEDWLLREPAERCDALDAVSRATTEAATLMLDHSWIELWAKRWVSAFCDYAELLRWQQPPLNADLIRMYLAQLVREAPWTVPWLDLVRSLELQATLMAEVRAALSDAHERSDPAYATRLVAALTSTEGAMT